MKTVVIVQRRMTHYRIPVFELMRADLAKKGINLRVLYGGPNAVEATKRDDGHLSWGERIPVWYAWGGSLCWQPLWGYLDNADLVVITPENKLLFNHILCLLPRRFKLAFWGHGKNFQSRAANGFREIFKAWEATKVDWWFAYTGVSQSVVKGLGFAEDRITNLQNAIDTKGLAELCLSISDQDVQLLRGKLGLAKGRTALYLGSLYEEKRIDFLLDSARLLAERLPGFSLVVVGDGPMRPYLEEAAIGSPWLRYVGAMTGREKALFMRLADVFLNPGAVGLGILDSFVAGAPLVTTDCGTHAPEIDYLENGKNGLTTENSVAAYVDGVAQVLVDDSYHMQLSKGAAESVRKYTVENMSERFCAGIVQVLDS